MPPPGWYLDPNGMTRWWTGTYWGEAAPPGSGFAPGGATAAGQSGYYQQPMVSLPRIAPPAPPWGTWTWADGSPIDITSLPSYEPDKKLVAGLLAIFAGGLGIHKFILGLTTEGVITIVVTLITCGLFHFVSLIEGIIYLTKSNEEFYWTYVVGRKKWF